MILSRPRPEEIFESRLQRSMVESVILGRCPRLGLKRAFGAKTDGTETGMQTRALLRRMLSVGRWTLSARPLAGQPRKLSGLSVFQTGRLEALPSETDQRSSV